MTVSGWVGDSDGSDRLHGLYRHRRSEVEPGGDRHEAEAKQDRLRIETIDRDVADHERHERSEIAEGPSRLAAVVLVTAESHGGPKVARYSRERAASSRCRKAL